ncbi:hypothetical protein H0G86_011404 [Trichoderma simmonsii]|uniref:Uncharacterized protein n=1 Tax=Trichoderma simmonsii TaxID=1491479 RepID=A0A8G0LPB0_9HYPO|nr:hypothetical protein H0G86_011404 [Trichoderma simmonsii]
MMSPPRADALVHIEKRTAEISLFPREEQEDPQHRGVDRCEGMKDVVARGPTGVVTVETQIAVAKAEDDGDKRAKHGTGP